MIVGTETNKITRMGTRAVFLVSALALAATTVNGFQREPLGIGRDSNPIRTTSVHSHYLDSLSSEPLHDLGSSSFPFERTPEQTMAETPEEHYAKDHFGAGWAGYKHPMYGGYLDHLSIASDEDDDDEPTTTTTTTTTTVFAAEEMPGTNNAILQTGKKADYGDDIRWGAQVYLDNL